MSLVAANDIPHVDTVGDIIELLKTADPKAKFRVPVGCVLLKKPDGTILVDDGLK